ncbi:MAG: histidinol-phosphatase [Bacteroidales bacterium]
MLTNHHTHSLFSDGSSQPEEYIIEAISKGFNILGFSEHSPLPFENKFSFRTENKDEYIALLQNLKQKYSSLISIFSGMEMDFIPGMSENFSKTKAEYKLDYLIGSVHLVRPRGSDELWFTDGPDFETYDQGLDELFGGDIKKAVTAYYYQLNEMIETQHIDIVGHLDKIKMHNRDRFFREDEMWYKSLVSETLELIQDRDIIVEVNTRGIYKQRSETTFPGLDILKQIKALRIPVMVNSDAHKPHELNLAFNDGFLLLKDAGIEEVVYFKRNGWGFETIQK